MKMKLLSTVVSAAFAAMTFNAAAAPLLMEGKTTLYQRVLTTPECVLKSSPTDAEGKPIPAFTRYYVYARNADGTLEVGPDTSDKKAGFIDSSCAIDWKMQLALLFTNPADRELALIFSDKAKLDAIIGADDAGAAAQPYYDSLKQTGKADGVAAQEPAEAAPRKQNYIVKL